MSQAPRCEGRPSKAQRQSRDDRSRRARERCRSPWVYKRLKAQRQLGQAHLSSHAHAAGHVHSRGHPVMPALNHAPPTPTFRIMPTHRPRATPTPTIPQSCRTPMHIPSHMPTRGPRATPASPSHAKYSGQCVQSGHLMAQRLQLIDDSVQGARLGDSVLALVQVGQLQVHLPSV